MIVFGDHVYDSKNEVTNILNKHVNYENIDLVIILGDLGYEIFDEFGIKGDKYFEQLEEIMKKIPVIFIAGNHDYSDEYELLFH